MKRDKSSQNNIFVAKGGGESRPTTGVKDSVTTTSAHDWKAQANAKTKVKIKRNILQHREKLMKDCDNCEKRLWSRRAVDGSH